MPVALDHVTQVVNVQWGEGSPVFVTGDYHAGQKYGTITNTDEPPNTDNPDPIDFQPINNTSFTYDATNLGILDGFITGGCYRNMAPENETPKPIFLLVGNNGAIVAEGSNDFQGIISASEDGKTWRTVFTAVAEQMQEHSMSSANIFGVVWDEDANAFYAGGHFFRSDAEAESGQSDLDKLWRSADGKSWTEVGSAPTTEDTTTGLFALHLNNKAKLPGGVFGYHEEKDENGEITRSILIKPVTPPKIDYASRQPTDTVPPVAAYFQAFSVSTKDAGNQVEITIKDGADTTTNTVTVDVLSFVNCCAYADGVIIAGGGVGTPDPPDVSDGRIAVSFDEGKTWELTGNSLYQVFTISGAPQADVGL